MSLGHGVVEVVEVTVVVVVVGVLTGTLGVRLLRAARLPGRLRLLLAGAASAAVAVRAREALLLGLLLLRAIRSCA